MVKEIIVINGAVGGVAKTVTAGYHKYFAASLLNFGTSGTFIMEKDCNVVNDTKNEKQDYRGWRIRKLTPREVLRLMSVDDADIDKMVAAGIPKTQLYKLAGNSLVTSVFTEILRKLFIEKENESPQLTLF